MDKKDVEQFGALRQQVGQFTQKAATAITLVNMLQDSVRIMSEQQALLAKIMTDNQKSEKQSDSASI